VSYEEGGAGEEDWVEQRRCREVNFQRPFAGVLTKPLADGGRNFFLPEDVSEGVDPAAFESAFVVVDLFEVPVEMCEEGECECECEFRDNDPMTIPEEVWMNDMFLHHAR
jgi:hypothetical protein